MSTLRTRVDDTRVAVTDYGAGIVTGTAQHEDGCWHVAYTLHTEDGTMAHAEPFAPTGCYTHAATVSQPYIGARHAAEAMLNVLAWATTTNWED